MTRTLAGVGGKQSFRLTVHRVIATLLHRVRALRRFHRRIIIVGLVLASGATLLLLVGYALTRGSPSWWRTRQANQAATAAAVENGVVNHLTAVRARDQAQKEAAAKTGEKWKSEAWSVSLQAADVNAWLAERLPRWLENRQPPVKWPRQVREVQVEFADGIVRVGTRVAAASGDESDRDQFLSVELRPELMDDGKLWLRASGVSVGALPVPSALAMEWVRQVSGELFTEMMEKVPEAKTTLEAMAGERPLVNDAVVRIDGGRRVRLLKIIAKNGRLDVTCRTEAK
jgi:hypothetical protein